MFEQQAPGPPPPAPSPTGWPPDTAIHDWIAGWQPAREDVLGLLNAYADEGHDISSFTPLIEQLDAAMRLLHHRVDWLRSSLGPSARPPHTRD